LKHENYEFELMTKRTEEDGRLFPSIKWDHGWSLSIQADKYGYQCSPKRKLDTLEDYETVEVKIDGPHGTYVDPHTMQLLPHVLDKFPKLTSDSGPSIGGNLTWDDVDVVKQAILLASLSPNDGVPSGAIGWSCREVYHGTSNENAEDILNYGIKPSIGTGYFGRAFYVADDVELAISNYAEFSDDENGGAVIVTTIKEGALILDLRNHKDNQKWIESGLVSIIGRDDFDLQARKRGIDGVYDRSVGGLAIFNAAILTKPHLINNTASSDVEIDANSPEIKM
jgi:hypothetical protein